MPWMLITCGSCGHRADIDEFTSTPVFGELPRNTYQCPYCRTAFERRVIRPGTYDAAIGLIPVAARL